jgi:hypothetical protein
MTAPGGWELVTETDERNPVLGDLRVAGSRLAKIATFGDAVRQAIAVRLRWWRGEWFLDTRQGTPWLEAVLRKGVSEASVRAVFKREIQRVEGVARVASITVSIDAATRYATIDASVITTEGETLSLTEVPIGAGGLA